jgi:hypothetical protein
MCHGLLGYRLGRRDEVLEDSIRNGIDTLKNRYRPPSLLPFLKIVANSMLA